MASPSWSRGCPHCGHPAPPSARPCPSCGASSLDLRPGRVLEGRYRVEARLQARGSVTLYRAWDTRLDCPQRLREERATGRTAADLDGDLRRLREEVRRFTSLRHPGLPRILDFFASGPCHYRVTDLVEGEDLDALLARDGDPGLPEPVVRDIALQALDILEYLHAQVPAVVHGGVRPGSIVRRRDGRIVLLGLGDPPGTPGPSGDGAACIAPEQYRGPAEGRSDVYALGAVLHHLLSGRSSVACGFEPLSLAAPEVSLPMAEAVHRALALDVEERFESARAMRDALAAATCAQPPGAGERREAGVVNDSSTGASSTSGLTGSPLPTTPRLARPLAWVRLEDDAAIRQAPALGKGQGLALSLGPGVTDAGLPALSHLVLLELLDLSHAAVTDGGFHHLRHLGSLRHLDLTATAVEGPGLAHLEACTRLETLVLASTRIPDLPPAFAERLGSLRELDLSRSRASDALLARLRGLASLEVLDLTHAAVTGAGLRHLASMRSLRVLRLAGDGITDSALQVLPFLSSLRTLTLACPRVTDAAVCDLERLPLLRTLVLQGTRIRPDGVTRLRSLLPALAIVRA